ncbi:MAG TPA: TraR/DksA C4-type zinc finger protein [Casimicrobiaceae bacterium]|nr:TraR/DksA C4-type zinc finger protein [Casimicrobiaceae bacterium]
MALSKKELAKLSRRLDERRQALMREVHDELEETDRREFGSLVGVLPGDTGDQSVADTEAHLNVAMTDRHAGELLSIDRAKARIAEGTYGICIDCGGEIGFERLCAYPTAERCIQDQERVERTYAQENRPTL